MNIVLVNVRLDPERGAGTAERTRHLARHLVELGCACSIITIGKTPWHAELTARGVRICSFPYLGNKFPVPLVRPIRLWRFIKEADVVHIMGYWYVLAAVAFLFARLARTPVVICPAGELSPFSDRRLLKRMYHRLIGRRMLAGAASVIATTVDERDHIMTQGGATLSPVFISPNGIAAAVEFGTAPPRLRVAPPFVLFLGRLTPIKGPDLLVEAFAQIRSEFPDVDLVIAGPDLGMRQGLEALARERSIAGRVHFVGFVVEDERSDLYRRAMVLAIPSRSEVMSMVALEAAVMGLPVLLTDRCGFPEVERTGGGRVVAASVNGLAEGLSAMLRDPTALPPMGERLRQFVLERYAWPIVARDLLAHLQSLPRR